MHDSALDGYLSLKTLSAYSGLSVRTLREYLIHPSRPLPHYRPGAKILVKRSEFDGWITTFRVNDARQDDAMLADLMRGL